MDTKADPELRQSDYLQASEGPAMHIRHCLHFDHAPGQLRFDLNIFLDQILSKLNLSIPRRIRKFFHQRGPMSRPTKVGAKSG